MFETKGYMIVFNTKGAFQKLELAGRTMARPVIL